MKRPNVRPQSNGKRGETAASRGRVKHRADHGAVGEPVEPEPIFYGATDSLFGSTSTIDDTFFRQAIAGRLRR